MVRHLSFPILPFLLLVLAAGSGYAQPPDARQRPSRDRSSQTRRPAGTASISGRVLSGDTGRPLARARVTASAPELQDGSVSTLTDQAGAYVLSELPAGSYTLTATKTAFLTLAFGARRPQRPGKRITVGQGQQVRDIDVRLPRGSVITGRVYDDNGEPIVRATVQAMRYQFLQGEPRLVGSGSGQTDDRGQFRIFGLVPGSYVVTAAARGESIPENASRASDPSVAQSYAPTYYPGVMNPADAAPILLGLQQEYSSVDFMLQTVPTSRVSGTVVGESGAGASAMVILVLDDARGVGAGTTYGGRVQDDGSFTVNGVPPGRYVAVARAATAGRARGGSFSGGAAPVGIQPVSVAGQDVTGLTIQLSASGTIAGWVSFDSASGQRADVGRLRLSTQPPMRLPFVGSETARVQPDGSFTISNVVAGSHLLRLNNPPGGWALKGVYLNGRDVTDQALDMKPGQTLSGVQVILTDKVTTITGSVLGGQSDDLADFYVVAFSADPSQWRSRSRTILGARADETGTYKLTGLPAGDYYLAVVSDIEPGSWYDPSLLDQWRKSATRVSVEEGDTKTVALKTAPARSTED